MRLKVIVMNCGKKNGAPAGYFDTTTKTYYPHHPSIGGIGSNFTVTLWGLARLINQGYLPEKINFKDTMEWYKDEKNDDIYPDIFQTDKSLIPLIDKTHHYPERKQYDPVDIHGNYRRLDYLHIVPLVNAYFAPSTNVTEEVQRLTNKLGVEPENLISVFYRGTDHWQEGAVIAPDKYLRLTEKILSQNKLCKILIQTDQLQVQELFLKKFPGQCVTIEELPVTDRTDKNSLINCLGVVPDKRNWNIIYMAALRLIAKSKFILNHTGNGGCWVNLFRGHSQRVYQFSIKGNLYRRPLPVVDYFSNLVFKGL